PVRHRSGRPRLQVPGGRREARGGRRLRDERHAPRRAAPGAPALGAVRRLRVPARVRGGLPGRAVPQDRPARPGQLQEGMVRGALGGERPALLSSRAGRCPVGWGEEAVMKNAETAESNQGRKSLKIKTSREAWPEGLFRPCQFLLY